MVKSIFFAIVHVAVTVSGIRQYGQIEVKTGRYNTYSYKPQLELKKEANILLRRLEETIVGVNNCIVANTVDCTELEDGKHIIMGGLEVNQMLRGRDPSCYLNRLSAITEASRCNGGGNLTFHKLCIEPGPNTNADSEIFPRDTTGLVLTTL